jgi:sugar phosphate isomerase/epimerase
MNISYCTLIYDGNEFQTAIKDSAKAGYSGIEIYPKDWEWALSQMSITDLKRLIGSSGLRVSGVFGGCLSSNSDFDNLIRAADIGSKLDCEYVFFVASGKQAKASFDFVSACKEVAKLLEVKGMVAVLHNHAGTVIETSDDAAKLCDAVSARNFGLCFDSVHYALFEDDLKKSVKRNRDFIKYVHLKDIKKDRFALARITPTAQWDWGNLEHIAREYTGLGEGVINNRAVVKALRDIGYDGWWMIEIERQEYDRSTHASRNINELRNYFEDGLSKEGA